MRLEKVGDGFAITHSDLICIAKVPNISEAKFAEIAEVTKSGCPVSKVLNAKISLVAKLQLADREIFAFAHNASDRLPEVTRYAHSVKVSALSDAGFPMKLRSFAVPGTALLFGVCAAAADLPPTQRLHSIDVFELEYTDDVQISPDGSRIVYVRVSHDIMTDRARRNLWIVNADGTNNRPLRSEAKNFMSPRWSPDGTRLAYVSAAEGSPQLYVRWIDTGQTALLTNLVQAPNAIAWSADGKSIAFTQLVPAKKPPLATPPEKPEGAQWAPPVKVIDSVVYRADGEGYLEAGFQHVFVVSAEGGTPRQLTEGEFNDDGPLSFTPDNKHIVFSANRGADWERDPQESEVFTVDIATEKLTQLTTRDGPDNWPVVSPDGRKIAYLGFDDRLQGYQVTHLYVMDSDGKNSREVTADLDRDVAEPRWSADSRSVYFSYDERGVRKLGVTSLGGKVRTLADGLGGTDLGRPYTSGSFSVARNGRAAFAHNTTARPADVATVAGAVTLHVLTDTQRRPARQQGPGRGEGDHLEVLEGSARDPGLGDHAAGLRCVEEVPADPRDPRRPVRGLWS